MMEVPSSITFPSECRATLQTRRGKWTSRRTFLKAHWGAIAATDFFTIEVVTGIGLVGHFVLFVIDLKSRRVHIAGIQTSDRGALGLVKCRGRLGGTLRYYHRQAA